MVWIRTKRARFFGRLAVGKAALMEASSGEWPAMDNKSMRRFPTCRHLRKGLKGRWATLRLILLWEGDWRRCVSQTANRYGRCQDIPAIPHDLVAARHSLGLSQ